MRRWPLIPTVLVALAVTAMIALGLWQLLVRLPEKEAYLAQLAANPGKPPIGSLDYPAASDDRLLFRRAQGVCLRPGEVRLTGAGAAGFRAIVDCQREEGTPYPAMTIALGTTRDPAARPIFRGGRINGFLSHAPDARPLLASLWDHSPRNLMLVAENPPPGLTRNAPPDLSAVPNNHLAYAVQWFLFAAVAAIIYALALRRRLIAAPARAR